jgi:CP family cyanate transporter-like MFS transporter
VTLRRPGVSGGTGSSGRAGQGGARRGLAAALLVAGIIALSLNLRAAITSVPPLFPEISARLHLSPGALAVLAAIPVVCFGLFSAVAAPLSRRFGEERVLGSALVVLAAGLLLRGIAPRSLLFPGTAVAAAAIALMNVLLPSLVKRRRPDQAGLLIGLYLMSLAGGAIIGSLVAVPVFTASGGITGPSGSVSASGRCLRCWLPWPGCRSSATARCQARPPRRVLPGTTACWR